MQRAPPGRCQRLMVSMRVQRFVRADATAPSQARDALVDLSPQVPPRAAQDLRLLVSELVTNAVKHAGLRKGEKIELDVRTRPEHAEVKVRYPEHVRFAPTLPAEPDEASRWGLLLVDRISDRWSLVETDDRVLAWFELDLSRRDAARHRVDRLTFPEEIRSWTSHRTPSHPLPRHRGAADRLSRLLNVNEERSS